MSSVLQISASLFSEGVRAISRNKSRSALAALGITIGIAAVVCVVAIGQAGSERLEEQLKSVVNARAILSLPWLQGIGHQR